MYALAMLSSKLIHCLNVLEKVIPGKDGASAAAAAGALLSGKGAASDKSPSSLKKLGTEPQVAAISKKGAKMLKVKSNKNSRCSMLIFPVTNLILINIGTAGG